MTAQELEMHKVSGAADLDVPFGRRLREFVEQATCVFVRQQAVPFVTDDGSGACTLQARGEAAVPGLDDLADCGRRADRRPARRLCALRLAATRPS